MNLDDLLHVEDCLEQDGLRFELWKDLTQGDALYQALEAEIGRRQDWNPLVEAARFWDEAYRDPSNDDVGLAAEHFFQASVFDPDGPIPSPRRWEALNEQVQNELKARLVHQARTLLALIRCARLAATRPERFEHEYDAAEFHIDARDFPPFYRDHPDLVWIWACTFLRKKVVLPHF